MRFFPRMLIRVHIYVYNICIPATSFDRTFMCEKVIPLVPNIKMYIHTFFCQSLTDIACLADLRRAIYMTWMHVMLLWQLSEVNCGYVSDEFERMDTTDTTSLNEAITWDILINRSRHYMYRILLCTYTFNCETNWSFRWLVIGYSTCVESSQSPSHSQGVGVLCSHSVI